MLNFLFSHCVLSMMRYQIHPVSVFHLEVYLLDYAILNAITLSCMNWSRVWIWGDGISIFLCGNKIPCSDQHMNAWIVSLLFLILASDRIDCSKIHTALSYYLFWPSRFISLQCFYRLIAICCIVHLFPSYLCQGATMNSVYINIAGTLAKGSWQRRNGLRLVIVKAMLLQSNQLSYKKVL